MKKIVASLLAAFWLMTSTADAHSIPGAQKVALKKESAQGGYQFSGLSKPSFYTQYIDEAGRQRMKLKPKEQFDDIQKVLMCVN